MERAEEKERKRTERAKEKERRQIEKSKEQERKRQQKQEMKKKSRETGQYIHVVAVAQNDKNFNVHHGLLMGTLCG